MTELVFRLCPGCGHLPMPVMLQRSAASPYTAPLIARGGPDHTQNCPYYSYPRRRLALGAR